MMSRDILCSVFQRLATIDLLRCTMVCRNYLSLIDKHLASTFQRHLMWNGYFFERWAPISHTSHVVFDFERSAFFGSVVIDKPLLQHVWRFNVVPIVSNYLSVRLRIRLPIDKIRVCGDKSVVDRFLELKEVSADIKSWEIMDVKSYQDKKCEGLGEMLLRGILDKHDSLIINTEHEILIMIKNVPVVPLPRINYRILCVMRGVLFCMNCFQREPKWQSVDAENARHRVLCATCFDMLFVTESTLAKKWMIRGNISKLDVKRAHFIFHQTQARHSLSANVPLRCVVKQKLSEALGHENWDALVSNNHIHYSSTTNTVKRYSFVR
jgi:hypothetical protein